mmetsp:Transcript_7718/g.10115  ORF Transcript_7718/g.10115 Transcript_7718/m.10115 type:complete len:188 (+) Transcript_7718:33-596(+)|eukprot:CAMPEP_0198144096 /NCGR_PEP_ID=MMETSP1443-20131203/12977_1 /TAXON_ID=186043 /ORGANISM="Entomoneis sp., Strain CCMP2396" /LENGTH=187 /DNA_ID=CAMNT_0043807439 /DNA_START=29 /DNA_END=592 /DNA_ORIENTATION=-
MKIAILTTVLLASASAYQPSTRRAFFRNAAAAAGVASAAPFLSSSPAQAIDACPKGSKNCIRTAWAPPAGTSKEDAAKTVIEVLNSYPQEGQADVDKGGWNIVSDELASSGTAVIEYKSGIGNFAKFLNGGKPFIDDLKLELSADGQVQGRSSSRVGDSDFGVNQKRLNFLSSGLRAKGWEVPEPKY